MHKKIALLAALALPSLASAAPYLVAGGANAKADMSEVEAYYGPNHDTKDSFGRAFVGVGADLSPNVGIEALYLTEGESTVQDSTQKDTIKNSGFQFALLGKAPLTPQLNVFGKISANYLTVTAKYEDYVAPVNNYNVDDSKFQLGYGFGVSYQFTDAVGARVALERIQVRDAINGSGNSDLDQASVGVTFAF